MSRALVEQLIALVEQSRLRELVYTHGGTRIRVVGREGPPGAVTSVMIRSGAIGVFHSKHPLAGTTCAREGEVVAQGQILGYLRTGAVLLPVIAPRRGRVRKQLLGDGAAAGRGDPLYLFEGVHVEMQKPLERGS